MLRVCEGKALAGSLPTTLLFNFLCPGIHPSSVPRAWAHFSLPQGCWLASQLAQPPAFDLEVVLAEALGRRRRRLFIWRYLQ